MADFISDRMTRDLTRSVDFRVRENQTGLRIAEEHPFWGAGPNHYREFLLKYEPEWQWALQYEEMSIKLLHIRPIAAPHNGFLLILAETGALGLLTFSIFLTGVAAAGVRAITRTTGAVRAACLGILVGLLGLLLQQAVDFSIWADPLLYTLALMAALCFHAPGHRLDQGGGLV
jgi:O-antigen ligase